MLAKTEDRKPQKGGGKKRKHPGQDGERKKRAGEGGDKGDGGRKRLDALSVGYFRRVGERLSEGFEDDDERGERDFFCDSFCVHLGRCSRKFHLCTIIMKQMCALD